jgi:hypothetical protein
MANMITPAPHLTFDEQADRDPQGSDAMPCYCWYAGHGDIAGLTADQVQHPDEYRDGAKSAFEELYDL